MDEARFGLRVWFRRRWCPFGFRPSWVFQDRYEWVWWYAAVEPSTGESFSLYLPRLGGDCFQVFLEALRRAYPGEAIVVVSDRSGSHTSEQVVWPEGIEALLLPGGSPELDPVERWFEELRGELSNTVFDTIEALEEALTRALRPYWEDRSKLARLTGYSWWVGPIAGIKTSTN
jgi:hypothetical protein